MVMTGVEGGVTSGGAITTVSIIYGPVVTTALLLPFVSIACTWKYQTPSASVDVAKTSTVSTVASGDVVASWSKT